MNIESAIKKYTNPRTAKLLQKFREFFPEEHEVYIAHAPGRVNLIGEHIDYNGFGVMPMSVDKEIEFCFVPSNDSTVTVYDAVKCGEKIFQISGDIDPYEMGDWGNYIKAPCQALFKWAEERYEDKIPLKGFKAVMIGDIPPAAGLSSSSAIVVCAGVIVSFVNRLRIDKSEFADLMARGEQYVGTMGGGMDQTASVFGHSKGPIRIMFKPIRVNQIIMPQGYSFIIANSLRKAKKSGEARYNFNNRSITCKFGLAILKNLIKNEYPDAVLSPSLRRLQKLIGWDNMPKFFNQIPTGGMKLAEISNLSDISIDDLREKYLRLGEFEYLPTPPEGFKIHDRLLHVFNEAKRVSDTKNAMLSNDMDTVAKLMDESHVSCRDLYEISTPEVEKLISCLKSAGTLGSRITGAGWGGCTVSLVRSEDADRIINEVWQSYYLDYAKDAKDLSPVPESKDKSTVIFSCIPAEGAGVREHKYKN